MLRLLHECDRTCCACICFGDKAERIGVDGGGRQVHVPHAVLFGQYAREILFFRFADMRELLVFCVRVERECHEVHHCTTAYMGRFRALDKSRETCILSLRLTKGESP